jgi:hypothetical protein
VRPPQAVYNMRPPQAVNSVLMQKCSQIIRHLGPIIEFASSLHPIHIFFGVTSASLALKNMYEYWRFSKKPEKITNNTVQEKIRSRL